MIGLIKKEGFECLFIVVIDDYWNHANFLFPFVGELIDFPLENFFNIASQGGHVDIILDLYVEKFIF
jgi:hypothetical protein